MLEEEIKETNACLANPECYQKIGLTELGQKLEALELEYEEVVDRFLELEEKVEMINNLV